MDVLERLKLRLSVDNDGDVDNLDISDAVLLDIMETAKHAILARRYPLSDDQPDELPNRYLDLQLRIALDLVNKMGAEGETGHSENGVSRTYQSSWISEDLLKEIVPYGKVI